MRLRAALPLCSLLLVACGDDDSPTTEPAADAGDLGDATSGDTAGDDAASDATGDAGATDAEGSGAGPEEPATGPEFDYSEAMPGVFLPPYTSCEAPLDGEEPGAGPDGQVCTNVAISGATEPGRKFAEYADCDIVLTQRPYSAREPYGTTADDDPRLDDDAFMAEVAWAREQVEATGCICCHSTGIAPAGPSNWYVEEPIWTDTVSDSGLALFAGWANSVALGAYPAEDNNGFDRTTLGLPTTDIERMRAFLEGELERRGLTRDDAASIEPFGGPIYTQLVYEPEACTRGAGVDEDGNVNWSGTPARYLYVLEEGSANPGVPPNLDTPEGTLWRLDVLPTNPPLDRGVPYGSVPEGAVQRVPADGPAPELTSGETYYLYVMADVGVPMSRCLFTAP